jgi:chromosomal replication initiator protein
LKGLNISRRLAVWFFALKSMIDESIYSPTPGTGDDAGSPEQIWAAARVALADRLSPGNYKTWIEPLKIYSAEGGRLVLAGPNPFFLNWVKTHFVGDLAAALAAVGFEASAPLELVIDLKQADSQAPALLSDEALPTSGPAHQSLAALQNPQPLRLGGDRFTFDNFVVGESNLYAFSAAKALAAGAALGSDSLFITSDHGLGKSHLSLALGRAFLQGGPRRQVYYLTAEDFTNEMTRALRHGSMEDFKAKYRQSCDVLVLEEVQFLSGKEKIQAELCFTLDCLMERGKKVIFTSPQEPKSIPRLGRSLKSRLSTALISPIGPPEYETRLNILVKKAKSIGLKTSRPVLEYVAERVTTDVRRLESCLASLKAKSQLLGRQVDLDMAREALHYLLDDQPEGGGLSPIAIRTLICRHFQLEAAQISSRDRSRRVNEARALGIYLSRQLTGRTLEEIGRVFGRTHSSTIYAINKMEQALKKDPRLQGKVEYFSQKLLSGQN